MERQAARRAVAISRSVRAVLILLRLIPTGGNYAQVKRRIEELNINTDHFTGTGWNTGWKHDPRSPAMTLEQVLVENST